MRFWRKNASYYMSAVATTGLNHTLKSSPRNISRRRKTSAPPEARRENKQVKLFLRSREMACFPRRKTPSVNARYEKKICTIFCLLGVFVWGSSCFTRNKISSGLKVQTRRTKPWPRYRGKHKKKTAQKEYWKYNDSEQRSLVIRKNKRAKKRYILTLLL